MADRNRDFRPEEGQQSNQNWDDNNNGAGQNTSNTARGTEQHERDSTKENKSQKKGDNRAVEEQINTTGAGSSQRRDDGNVGPLDSDLDELPSKTRINRSNQTGPGLG